MIKNILLVILLIFTFSTVQAATKTSTGTGNWNTAGTWSPSGVPGIGDDVIIAATHTVTIDVNTNSLASLTISGTLTIGDNNTNRIVTVTGNITINSGGIFQSAGNGGNDLTSAGNLINNGTFDMNTAGDADVTFSSTAANQTVSGTGGTTDFNLIIINNTGAANNNIVEISSTNFTVPTDFLTLTAGIFKVSGSFALSNTFFPIAAYTIPAAAGIWLNNTNATVTAQNGSPTLNGSLKVTSGVYNIGTVSGNTLQYNTGASFIMEGGTVTIAGRFIGVTPATDQIIFNMSAGTMTVANVGNAGNSLGSFDIGNAGSSFTMSGGTIILKNENTNATPLDYRNIAGTVNITGGTVQFATATTAGSPTFVAGITPTTNIFPGLSIVKAVTATTVTLSTPVTIFGNLNIATTTTLNANSQAIAVSGNSSNPGNWTNNNSFIAGTQTTTFNGTNGAQSIGGSAFTSFSTLVFNNTAGFTLANNASVAATATFTNGIITPSPATNILTFGTGATSGPSSNTSFVNGRVTKSFGAAEPLFNFPVGSVGTGDEPIGLSNTVNGYVFTAQYVRSSATALGGVTAPILNVSACDHWILTNTSTFFTTPPSITLSWDANSPCNANPYITNLSGLTVAHFTGPNWDEAGTGVATTTGNNTTGTVRRDNVTVFSPFSIANTLIDQNPLPVTFSDVKAFEKNNGVQVEWTNLTEKDLVSYTVERSANGRDFTGISQQSPRSNQNNKESYISFDASPFAGVNFYRIKTFEINGKMNYSKLLKVDIGRITKGISLYPNPVIGNELSIGFTAARGQYTLRVINGTGQEVYTQRLTHPGGNVSQAIALPSTIKPGVYNMLISSDNYKETKMFIVQ